MPLFGEKRVREIAHQMTHTRVNLAVEGRCGLCEIYVKILDGDIGGRFRQTGTLPLDSVISLLFDDSACLPPLQILEGGL
jgi:hypothetical protein